MYDYLKLKQIKMENKKLYKEIAQDIFDRIEYYEGTRADELHHNLFNTDYYIIGTYESKQWLERYGAFDCIGLVRDYEQDCFGEITTDITDPERVVNMAVYIIGEDILNNLSLFQKVLQENREFSTSWITAIKKELKTKYNL